MTSKVIVLSVKQIKELYELIKDELPDTEINIGEDKETGEGYFAWFDEVAGEVIYYDLNILKHNI